MIDGVVHKLDIYAEGDSWYLAVDDMKALFGGSYEGSYVALSDYAKQEDIRYTQDESLHAVYFNTWESYNGTGIDLMIFDSYISAMGLSTEKAEQENITGQEMSKLLDAFVAYAAPEKSEAWQSMFPIFRAGTSPITRFDAMTSIFLAAQHIGGDFSKQEYSFDTVAYDLLELIQQDGNTPNMDYFGSDTYDLGDFGHDHCGIGAVCYNLTNFCSIDNSYPISLDRTENSFHMYDSITYADAMAALLRVTSVRIGGWVHIDDPQAVSVSAVLTEEHITKAQSNTQFTAENAPTLQGFVGGMEYSGGLTSTSPEDLILTANWGFHSFCFKFDYAMLFDENVQQVNLNNLVYLDGLVATAIENNLHLCLMAVSLPGRTVDYSNEDHSSAGDFDLFINPKKQELANKMWAILAQRYRDIPSANLSFCPFWEADNKNLSTGLPAPEYNAQDIADYLSCVVDEIRSKDADRMIIYEPSSMQEGRETWEAGLAVAEEKGNMLILSNYVAYPFVYASMTAEEGQHIDNNNHGIELPMYPTYYYELDDFTAYEDPLIFDGFLPAGTTINIYLSSNHTTNVEFYADGTLIHQEALTSAEYKVGSPLSGFMPFAVSDKKISVTLSETAQQVKITPTPDSYFIWCGIEVILPEEYAKEKWFFDSDYDVFLGIADEAGLAFRTTSTILIYPTGGSDINKATIHDDVSFSTAKISSKADAEYINSYFDLLKESEEQRIIRYEGASFSGMIWEEVKEYYTDLHTALSNHGFSWFSNDWNDITRNSVGNYAGCSTVEYMGYSNFNLELLELLQSFQK